MKILRPVLLAFYFVFTVACYGRYKKSLNPLLSNYGAKKHVVMTPAPKSLVNTINPQRNNAMIMENPRATSFRTSTTTTQIQIPSAPSVPQHSSAPSHHHGMTVPAYPAPSPGPRVAHSHPPPHHSEPMPPAGIPHVHSGHPYIAPAVAPQRMTYQQIIEYLANSKGLGLADNLFNASGNSLLACKTYCDTLPESPVCDSTNVLYRNECVAKCVNKKATTSNLRYGICCCSDEDFDYSNSLRRVYNSGTTGNLCISTCIFNCLGQDQNIKNEHVKNYPDFTSSRSDHGCAKLK